MIRHNKRAAIRRDARLDGLFAGACHRNLASAIKIKNAYAIGAVVGDVGPVSSRVDGNKGWLAVNQNRRDDTVDLSVDYRDGAGLSVGDVDLVSSRINGQIGWVRAHLKRAILTQVDEIEHRDCVRSPVADVGILSVADWNVGEAAPSAT